MNASEKFKSVIENYLTQTALNDSAFAPMFAKTTKNIEDCLKYIMSEVKKTGLCAFDDCEVFAMAVKYYIDDSITKPVHTNCKVMINQPVKADLFSTPIETAPIAEVKTPVKETPKPAPTTLTLFDL
jgi:hypothetical protein